MLQHSEDQIGLYGGWGADKPIVQVNMETDPLGTPYRLRKFPRGGQADLVHSTIDHEPEVFLYRRCHGDVQICILYVNGHNPFALFDGWPDWCLGFHLELQMTRWSFRWERSMTRHRSPGVFGNRKKETAEETLRFWMEHWLDCPFGQELFHCCLQVLGCIPGAEGDGYVSQWGLWLLLQQDCLQGCMMHGNCLAGSAAGSWWGQVLWWKSRLHGNDLVRVFYSQTPSHSPAAVDIAVGTAAVAAGMHLFREQAWGQKVPPWIQKDREWLVPMAAWFRKLAESLPCITCWSLRCMISW